jgi:hypothetical protein
MEIKVGARLKSAVCSTEVIVVRVPAGDVDLRCGGAPMLAHDADVTASGEVAADASDGTALGKRYVDDEAGLELLCTKAGPGSLQVGARALTLKAAKPLPSSD